MSSNFLILAKKACRHFHAGQRFKYTDGPYHEHPETVAELVATTRQKVLALLHDVIEETVKHKYAEYLSEPFDPEYEELAIELAFEDLRTFFQSHGASASELEFFEKLVPDLDALTKRSSESYEQYRSRLIRHYKDTGSVDPIVVKRADSYHNGLMDRNPPTRRPGQNPKTVVKKQRYQDNDDIFSQVCPESIQYLRREIWRNFQPRTSSHRSEIRYDPRRPKRHRLNWADNWDNNPRL